MVASERTYCPTCGFFCGRKASTEHHLSRVSSSRSWPAVGNGLHRVLRRRSVQIAGCAVLHGRYREPVSGPLPAATSRPPSSRRPAGYVFAAGAVILVAVYLTVVTVHHWGRPVYAVPSVALAISVTSAALAIAGAVGMVAVRRRDAALVSALVGLLMAVGVLALFSIGLLFLLAGTGIAIALARRLSGSEPAAVAVAVASGAAIAVGLATAALLAIQPPVVECSDNGIRISSSIWSGGSSSGSSRGGPGGYSTGTITQGSTTYKFTCSDGHLVEFRSATPD